LYSSQLARSMQGHMPHPLCLVSRQEQPGVATGADDDDDDSGWRAIHVAATGARVTRRQAIAALCRYTSTLPCDQYFNPAPKCVVLMRTPMPVPSGCAFEQTGGLLLISTNTFRSC
jgi:hypothetical protein